MSNPPNTPPGAAPQVTRRDVRYHADAASLFAHLGGTTTPDSVLLESADITTRSGLQSVAVLRASLRGLHPQIETLLAEAGIPPTARAEEIGLDRFCALARALKTQPAG